MTIHKFNFSKKFQLLNTIKHSIFILLLGMFLNIYTIKNSYSYTHVGVAVYVNNTTITNTDILERAKLTAGELGINFLNNKDMLLKNTTRTLIIESIQIQYAKSKGIKITKKDLDNYLVEIVKKLRYKNGIRAFLKDSNVGMKTYREKAYAKLLWQKVIEKTTNNEVMINQKSMRQRMINLSKAEDYYNLSEIVLPFKSDNDITPTLALAKKIHDKITLDVNNFGMYALKFSQSATSSGEGNLGLVNLASLSKEYRKEVIALKPNAFTQPLVLNNRIVMFKRNAENNSASAHKKVDSIKFYRLVLQTAELQKSGALSMQDLLSGVMNYALNCGDLETYAKKLDSKNSGYSNEVPVSTLSAQYKQLLLGLHIGEMKPVRIPSGIMIAMVCTREQAIPKLIHKRDLNTMKKEIFTLIFSQNSTNILNDMYSSALISYFPQPKDID